MGSDAEEDRRGLLGNGVVGILAESINIWERRTALTPSHCGRLLLSGRTNGVKRIIVQPSTKRIYHDQQYEDVGCDISEDLSECGLIVGIKQPKLEMILPDRGYAFFSHTHKAQRENMPLLDKMLEERVTLFDYELIAGDDGKRTLAFGKFAGRAGLIDMLHGLGQRYLNLGYSTPFLSLGQSYMYPSLAAAKGAVISVGEEIATLGLPSGISPIVFVFTGDGNVSQGSQEIFKLLPHVFIKPNELPQLFMEERAKRNSQKRKRNFQVYGCIVTSEDMVSPNDSSESFSKVDYYSHPEHYHSVFHERIAPYASVIVNCMYWEKRFPQLLSCKQLQELAQTGCPLVGICDITCDIGGSLEFVNRSTFIERPFFRYNPLTNTYHDDMGGDGIVCLAVDILPTEFSREASQHFGDIFSKYVFKLASCKNLTDLPSHLKKACITYQGVLTPLYEYIPRMRRSSIECAPMLSTGLPKTMYHTTVSLSGHLFDKFLINEALDIIEAAGGSFNLVKCALGQSSDDVSYSELEVGADDTATLDKILDSLTALADHSSEGGNIKERELSLNITKHNASGMEDIVPDKGLTALILGAGRVCRPAVEFLVSPQSHNTKIHVVVASLYVKDAEEIVKGLKNATAIQLNIADTEKVSDCISQVDVVISLVPPSFHVSVAELCIKHKKSLVTASYIDESMLKLDKAAKDAGVTVLCEMGLDPGIDHMMAMKMIDQTHRANGKVKTYSSYCGGLPAPAAANNPLAYKFSWNPAGVIKAGMASAVYKFHKEVIHVNGNELYDSANRFRLPELPAFALEYLPNRDSLKYGDLYGISDEASTIFRATLRYEGFSGTMSTLAKIGFFDTTPHPFLNKNIRPTFKAFLAMLLNANSSTSASSRGYKVEDDVILAVLNLGQCKDEETIIKVVKTIKFLGLHEDVKIPESCVSSFDVICLKMEERLAYGQNEQDMVLLHNEVEVEFPDGRPAEKHSATLLEFGKTQDGKMTTAMALTVGVPVAIGSMLLLLHKVQKRGVIRPLDPDIYLPALEMLEAFGIKLLEKVEIS